MQTTPHGSDLQEKSDQPGVPPGGSSNRTFLSGARRAGSGPWPDANVTALRQPSTRDPERHQQAPVGRRCGGRPASDRQPGPGSCRRTRRAGRWPRECWRARSAGPTPGSAFGMPDSTAQGPRAVPDDSPAAARRDGGWHTGGRPGLRAVERPGRRPRRPTGCRATDPTTEPGCHGHRTAAIQAGAARESGGRPGSGGAAVTRPPTAADLGRPAGAAQHGERPTAPA